MAVFSLQHLRTPTPDQSSPLAAGCTAAPEAGHLEPSRSDRESDELLEAEVQPLTSCQLSRGWISSVQLASGGAGGEAGRYLLSASNDGVVRTWDLHVRDAEDHVPKMLWSGSNEHTSGMRQI